MSTIDDWRFSTDRLLLRPFEASDAPFVLELLRDPGWRRFVGSTPADDIGDAERYVERLRASYAKHGFGLLLAETDPATPVGMCGLVRRESLPHPDLGFAFLSAHAGHGYATEAGLAVLDRMFSLQVTGTLLAITDPANAASVRVLEKLGFELLETRVLTEGAEPSRVFEYRTSEGKRRSNV